METQTGNQANTQNELSVQRTGSHKRKFSIRKGTRNYRRMLLGIALFPIATLLLPSNAALADTLRTRDFRVTITNNCPEGNVTCNDVTYYGTNLKTGASIQLTGKTVHTLCADGVTPCQFLGYEFSNGKYRYVVTENGRLQVYQGRKLLLDQRGNWMR